ncbi:hypothetical protein RHMOL_Rhmol04G0070800 [Rhododendron molle]|uniref:Uncharacterized protein n=1 Tax=Rhododendron molle TaxID=49168 RepID=A0ACC0P093_RHOML|nr:hypothetical protein RHMOL_Rhmol04G0070800 [Rhododendron molle]
MMMKASAAVVATMEGGNSAMVVAAMEGDEGRPERRQQGLSFWTCIKILKKQSERKNQNHDRLYHTLRSTLSYIEIYL